MKKTFKNAVKVLNWRLDKYDAEYKEIDKEIQNMQDNENITWNGVSLCSKIDART